jgi:hypothetical protein
MSIALERAKRPAPVWRCYFGNRDFVLLSSLAVSLLGAKLGNHSNQFP